MPGRVDSGFHCLRRASGRRQKDLAPAIQIKHHRVRRFVMQGLAIAVPQHLQEPNHMPVDTPAA